MGDCCRLTENSYEFFFSTANQDQIAAMRYMRLSGWYKHLSGFRLHKCI